jgi:peptidylprolyl isomerase
MMTNNFLYGSLVKVHYTLTVAGKVVDSSRGQEPFEFQVGMHQVIPGFEKALKDMKVGEKKSFQVSPDEGCGQENPSSIYEVSRDELPPEIEPKVGMRLYTREPIGQTIPMRIMEVKKDVVVMDFNHPLAGKTLHFEAEIIEIKQGE